MALRERLLPRLSQPQEAAWLDPSIGGWGTAVVGSHWRELVAGSPVTQFNTVYRMEVVGSRVGRALSPASGTAIAAATWLPCEDMGAVIGTSALWHGVIRSASGNSVQTGLFGRYTTTSGGAGYAAQFFLRVTTGGFISLDVNVGAGPVTYTTGLAVTYGEPLTILIRFTAAGADIISSVGRESVAISGMVSAVGIYTATAYATVGADRWNYTGHPQQETAFAAWARTPLPDSLVVAPWTAFEPQKVYGPAAVAGGGGGVTGTLSATESGADTAAVSGAVVISGAASAVESGSDTAAAAGSVLVQGLLAAVESGADSASLAGQIIVTGLVSAAESGSDTASISGGAMGTVTGSIAANEVGSDTATAVGGVLVSGDVSATETGSDTAQIYETAPTVEPLRFDIATGRLVRIISGSIAISF